MAKNSSIKTNLKTILKEIETVLQETNDYHVDLVIHDILKAKTIILVGAGRVGFAAKGFAMRLGHMGLRSYFYGDTTLPSIKKGDLLIACSGSGETQTVYDIAEIAKRNGARVLAVSSYIEHNKSRMTKLADTVMVINAPNKEKKIKGFRSVQPMTTLNEQCMAIFFDALVLLLMERLKESHDTMLRRHSNLE
jgi:6-phospho-3-hexuloisomerase